jgi:hypothetical protein
MMVLFRTMHAAFRTDDGALSHGYPWQLGGTPTIRIENPNY